MTETAQNVVAFNPGAAGQRPPDAKRCAHILGNGSRCSLWQTRSGLCHRHLEKPSDESHLEQQEKLKNYCDAAIDVLFAIAMDISEESKVRVTSCKLILDRGGHGSSQSIDVNRNDGEAPTSEIDFGEFKGKQISQLTNAEFATYRVEFALKLLESQQPEAVAEREKVREAIEAELYAIRVQHDKVIVELEKTSDRDERAALAVRRDDLAYAIQKLDEQKEATRV